MIIDSLDKIIQLKIVYFGPALSGKTTSLKSLFNHFGKKEKVKSIESTVNRTLFFDYGTISFQNEKWKLKLHIYSTTGQDFYIVTRPITLRAVDGLIFVADSQRSAYERNLISWNELDTYFDYSLKILPKIIAFNKQDLPDKFSHISFLEKIDYKKYENIDIEFTIALNGEGILSSFENILRLIFKDLYKSKLISSLC
ncbi:MAG: ATP/GTP-binding protein [Candidatus Heimdallarchaeota archaeon]